MAETVEEERWGHIRGVTVTTVASLAGIVAGVIAAHVAADPQDLVGLAVFGGAVIVQFPLLRGVGIEVETFGVKDYLFIIFMTFCFWFVTWGIMLTTEARLPI